MKKLATLSAVIAFASSAHAQAPAKVTFNDHVLPIFRNACNNCHNPDKKKAGLDLTTYQGALQGSENGQVVQSGNAGGSLLLKCVKGTEEPKMPPKGDRLSESELALVEKWIAGQLLETATGKAVAAANNNVQVAVVSLTRPDGPPPMPGDLPLEPVVRTERPNALTALGASPWAPLVAVGGQKQIILYNTETLEPLGILPFPEGFPAIIRFSRNGQVLLTGGGLGGKSGKVALWDVKTGERIATVGDEVDQVLAADLSADHRFVALGGPNKMVKIYSTKDGKLLHTIKKHTDWVTALAYSPDGRYLASADRNGGLQVWEGESAKEFNTLTGHKSMVTGVAFMTGVVASASEDGTIKLWDAKEGKEIKSWEAHKGGVQSVDFTPDGRLVSCGRDKIACVWDQTGKQITKSEAFSDIALRAELNSERVIAGDWTGQIRVFAIDGKPLGELSSNPPSIAERTEQARKKLAKLEGARPDLAATFAALEAKQNSAEENRQAEPAVDKKAELTKKVEQLTGEVAQLREARGSKTAGTPEYTEANAKVQAKKAEIQQAEAALAAAQNTQTAASAAPPVNEEWTKAKAALEEADAQIASAKAEIVKWERAQSFMTVHRARATLSEKQAQYEELIATAKEALTPVDQVQAALAAAEKAAAEAPAQIKEQELALAEAKSAAEPLGKAVGAAEAALAEKEKQEKPLGDALTAATAAAMELARKVEEQTAKIAKRREERGKKQAGTPEYAELDAKVQAMKPEMAETQTALTAAQAKGAELKKQSEGLRAEIPKLRESLEQARTAAKTAGEKLQAAEQALAKAQAAANENAAKLAELRRTEPEIIAAAKQAKIDAERGAVIAEKELQSAKAQAEQLRAEFESRWNSGEKSASSPAAPAQAKS